MPAITGLQENITERKNSSQK